MPDEAPQQTSNTAAVIAAAPAPAAPPLPSATSIPISQKSQPRVTSAVPASAVIGLEDGETIKSVLGDADRKMRDQQPKRTDLPRDEEGRFIRAKSGSKPKAAAKPKAPAAGANGAAPATPPSTPAQAPGAPPVAGGAEPAKIIKVGNREYTEEELQKLIEKPAPAPVAAAPEPPKAPEKPAPQVPPQEPAKPAHTPEQVAEAEKRYIDALVPRITAGIDEVTLENILIGGADGVTALEGVLKNAIARSILETRKSIYDELNPHLKQLHEKVQPIIQNSVEMQRYETQHKFLTKFPEYTEHMDEAALIASELINQYPQHVERMSQDQFIDEVERQLNIVKQAEFKRWYPAFQGTWKDWKKAQAGNGAPAAPAAVAPTNGAPPAPKPAGPPVPPAPPKIITKAPASNSPGTLAGAKPRDWQREMARSLQD